MQINAHARLRQQEVEAISYEQYAQVIASLDTSKLQAFSFTLPSILRTLKGEISKVVEHLKGVGVGVADIVKAFQEKSVFKLLKGVGFTLGKLLKAVKTAMAIPSRSLFAALSDLAAEFKNTKFMKALKPAERIAKLEGLIKKHPILTKVTGVAVAGLLIVMYVKSSCTGDIDWDLSLVDDVLAALHGNFSLVDMFTSNEGLYAIAAVIFGVATGMSVLDYGASTVTAIAKFIDEDTYGLLLALFYAGARKLKKHYDGMPKQLKAHRTQDWLHGLSHEERMAYLKKYPGSKFKDKTKLIHPGAPAGYYEGNPKGLPPSKDTSLC